MYSKSCLQLGFEQLEAAAAPEKNLAFDACGPVSLDRESPERRLGADRDPLVCRGYFVSEQDTFAVQSIADDADYLFIRLEKAEVRAAVVEYREAFVCLNRQQRRSESDSPCSPNFRGEEGLGAHDFDGRAHVRDERGELKKALGGEQHALVVGVQVAQTRDVAVEARVIRLEGVDIAEERFELRLLEPQEEDQAVLVEVLLVREDWNVLQV